jgi:iron complex transport system substrate-binding protein
MSIAEVVGLALVLVYAPYVYAEVSALDDLGERITLANPARRIISLAPHITELLFAAGAGGQIVGVVDHSDYPPAAQNILRIGAYNSVSHEALIALTPDLIVAWHSGNGSEQIRRLRALGLNVYANEPRKLPDIARSLVDFARLSGHLETGSQAAEQFLSTYRELHRRNQDRSIVRVFYQVWNQPLITMNGKHVISDVIRLCGGENVFEDAIPLAPRISVESVLRLDPDVIVASGMAQARPEWLDMWTAWPSIKAVRNNHLYYIPPDLLQRHTPRLLDGAKTLCKQLDKVRNDLAR